MIKRIFTLSFIFFTSHLVFGQSIKEGHPLFREIEAITPSYSPHLLTIYVIPSKVNYNWSSPRTLYKSYIKNFKRNIFKKESYLLGHAFIELITPLADSDIFTGMRSASREEQKNYVLKEHYGLSILGADLQGRLERSDNLEKKVAEYSKKGELAFISILINKEAAERMLRFFEAYKAEEDSINSPKFHYGGAFWPRYYGEGAGCSAFAISFLDLGGLLGEEYDDWKVEVNIPLDLMGGPYNDGKEVRFKDIKKRDHWADGSPENQGTYEPFEIYDPTLMYDWIQEKWGAPEKETSLNIRPVEINKAKGILIDGRKVPAPINDSIFTQREKRSVFVDYYLEKIGR